MSDEHHLGKLTKAHAAAYRAAERARRYEPHKRILHLPRDTYDTLREAETIERKVLRMPPLPDNYIVLRGQRWAHVRLMPKGPRS